MLTRRSLTTKQREELYERCRGERKFPDCNICFLPIHPGQRWHESHDPLLPRALGGVATGIAHERCNLQHNHHHDTPLVAKITRVRRKDIGAFRSYRPMLGSRASGVSKPFRGPPIDRRTGEPWMPR